MTAQDESQPAKRGDLLVVGRDPARRMQIAEGVESHRPGDFRIRSVSPDKLVEPQQWVDASAAVVIVAGADCGRDLEPLSKLREIPCGTRVVLILDRALPSLDAQSFVALLEPATILDDPPSVLSLGSAIDVVLPAGEVPSVRKQHRSTPGLLGVSRAIRDITDDVRRVAASRMPILILGETGTGKEVVARAIHHESERSGRPFVAINTGAFPEALLESELFGNDRGAFTGASRDRPGVFEQADTGTLFLDEIGEMPATMQVKLLRVLEAGEIRRLGATKSTRVDVRIVSATHRDLERESQEGRFRQDLLFRLNTATITLPPLRRRAVDIPFLAQHFAEEFGAENAREITLSEDFIEALYEHDFPGNVRELRNAVERAIAIAAPGEALARKHLPADLTASSPWQHAGTLKERIEQLEAHVIRATLDRLAGNRTKTAEALGLSRAGLRQKIRRLGLD